MILKLKLFSTIIFLLIIFIKNQIVKLLIKTIRNIFYILSFGKVFNKPNINRTKNNLFTKNVQIGMEKNIHVAIYIILYTSISGIIFVKI